MPNFELTALYEFSSQESFSSYELLFEDLVAKLSRILAARRIVMEVAQRRIFSWGFGRRKPDLNTRLDDHFPVYERPLGKERELGRIWLEKTTPFKEDEKRLLAIYFRQIEKTFYAIRNSEKLASANNRFLKVVENAPFVAIHGYDREGRVLYWNKAAEDLFGFTKNDVLGRKVSTDLLEPNLNRLFQQTLESAHKEAEGPHVTENQITTRSGKQHTALSYMLTVGEEESTREFIRMDVDITERKRMEEQLRFNSLRDMLTGLYNRNFFEQEMKRLDKIGMMPMALVVCDLDGLKQANDTLGHQAGDDMLISAANILKSLFRRNDMIARIGGDEFVVLMEKATVEDTAKIIQRIRNSIERHNLCKPELPLSMSIGYAVKTHPEIRPSELFKEADAHMYLEKQHRHESNPTASLGPGN